MEKSHPKLYAFVSFVTETCLVTFTCAPIICPTLSQKAKLDVPQMVLCHHGYRDCIDTSPQPTIQRALAVLGFSPSFRHECVSFHCIPDSFHTAVHIVSRDLVRNDSPLHTVSICGNFSDGPRDHNQYDCLCVRTNLGNVGHLFGERTYQFLNPSQLFDIYRLGLYGGLIRS